MEYDNGSMYTLSAEYLRIYSPAVDSKIRSVGGEKVIGLKYFHFCNIHFRCEYLP